MARHLLLVLVLALPFAATLVPGVIDGLSSEPAITVQAPARLSTSGRAGQPHHEAGAADRPGRIHPVLREQTATQGVNDLPADREAETGMLAEVFGLGPL